MSIRAVVLVEPFGPTDLTICKTSGDAVRLVASYTEQGKRSRLIETTGTVHDIKPVQQALRADYVKSLADRVAS